LATKSTSTNPAVFFSWTATADARVSSAVWADPVSYTVGFKSADSLPGNRPYYETDMNIPLPFTSETILSGIYDDIKTNFKAVTSYDLSYVTFKIPDKNCGTLLLNYDVIKKTGTSVSATTKLYVSKNPNLSKVTLVPAKDYTGAFEITYNAYTEGGSFITGQLEVKVNSNAGGTFSYVTDKNTPIQFDARDFQAAFLTATGKPLSYVRFSLPASSDGYLCYNYHLSGDYDSAVSSGSRYYVNTSQYLSYVTFVPSEDVTGRVIVYYTGYTENAYDYGGYSGKLYIDVADSPAGIVQYSVRENGSVMLTGGDFTEEFISVTGALLSHVTFTPPVASSGSLLFKYDADTETGTKVTSAVKYYDGRNPDISDITFMPAKDFTGTCVVPFTAYTAGGASYAGKLKFNIFEGSDVISYTTGAGKPVSMNSSDFMSAFYMNSGGKTLSYVTFELPSASYGRFYYNYTSPARYDEAVAVSRKYYVSGTPYLSNVSFVPQEGYTGSFSIAYTGYTSGGISCAGKIKITVSGAAGGAVSYETNSMTPVTFKAADFVAAFTGKTGNPLYYVRFTQPNASFGTLYEQYNPQLSYNTQVTPSKSYYVNYPTYISNVTFIPNAGFSGTLAIGYTAYDTYGYSSAGTILITVSSSELGTITYGTGMNMPVPFDANNFNTVFLNKTGATLSHVTFTLPPSSAGSLYFRYNTGAASSVTSSTKYYRSYSPLLSDISFVPRTDYSGSVTIPYMGYTAGNAAFSGKIVINVGTVAPYTDMGGHTWAQDAVDYLYSNGVIADNGSRYFYPGADMTRGEYMVMIANAFHLTGAGSGTFPDVPVGSPYYDAVAAAKAYDIARGDDTGLFRPEWGLTRQDAMVIIVRAFKNTGTPLTPGTIGDLAGFSDASLVSDYAVADLAALVRIGFVVGSGDRLNPKVTFSRAEAAVLLYRILIM
ncbi:MAG: S-layer homology domain-containing protein, partial [Clostridiales bacterium]|nr:S-layer homology domain-containing protein [Clostridiales bacterium]